MAATEKCAEQRTCGARPGATDTYSVSVGAVQHDESTTLPARSMLGVPLMYGSAAIGLACPDDELRAHLYTTAVCQAVASVPPLAGSANRQAPVAAGARADLRAIKRQNLHLPRAAALDEERRGSPSRALGVDEILALVADWTG